ncbi:hypothetical protein TSUD_250590 [Trifolium subterraneum]|nr:hypothetical protein TSUD_250590 [Trifolium subterraneum]
MPTPWLDGTPLRERCGRLFDLAVNKSVFVADMFQLGWGVGGEAWVWRQPLRAWEEEMLGECQALLLTISLQTHSSDRWLWRSGLDCGFSVSDACRLLTDQDAITYQSKPDLSRHSSSGDSLCVSSCGAVESTQYVFLSCGVFGSLWPLVSSWVGSASVTAQTLSDRFILFTTSAGGSRARHSFLQLI